MSEALRYVDSPAALAELCQSLRHSPWLALDTEFIRERTYYPRLCLIQVADADTVACVDPLALDDLDPLLDLLYDPAIIKVLHSAYQDLEIFYHLRGAVPGPVFDTQVAATLLGHGEQMGYAALVMDMLGVELDKSQSRTDWTRRPLDPAQLRYAADDVRFLRGVYLRQRADLERRDRLDWLEDDFRELCEPGRYRVEPQEVWRRIKGHHQLKGAQLAVLRTLAAWREEQAIAADRPRRWILGDDVLLDLARRQPQDGDQLKHSRGLEAGALKRHGVTLLELIAQGRAAPPEQWPRQTPRLKLDAQQDALMDAMMALVRLRGAHHGVSPQTLAGRRDLERLLADDPDTALLHGWRARLAGREVMALLRGELRLEVHGGRLCALPIQGADSAPSTPTPASRDR